MASHANILNAGRRRKESLRQLIDAIDNPVSSSAAPRSPTFHALLVSLQRFGEKQLDFFLNGFQPGGSLQEQPLYSAEYALAVTHNQLGYDLDVILRAYHHRTHRISPVGQARTGMRVRLEEADLAAQKTLQPAYEQGLLPQRAVAITYYQKSPSVRMIPYAPAALVGIPFSAAGEPGDMAAIAHEVGHYVFWRRPSDGRDATPHPAQNFLERSRAILRAEPPANKTLELIDAWQEEIFADLYGCLVAGPMAGLTMLEMARQLPGPRWFEDDGEHPPPALRSIAYLACLRRMADSTQGEAHKRICAAIEQMQNAQDNWLGKIPDWMTLRLHTGRIVSYVRLRQMIEVVVERYLSSDAGMLGGLLPQGEQIPALWDESPFDRTGIEAESDWAQFPPPAADLRLIEKEGQPALKFADEADDSSWPAGESGPEKMAWEEARDDDDAAIHALTVDGWNPWWLAVLSAGFWTTEGPGPGNPQPPG